jgi:hypothetical protein
MLYKLWSFTGVTMKNHVFWDIETQFLPHRTYIKSPLKTSLLKLCTIWGSHGSDYEECCVLGYKKLFRTSLETHYHCATKPSQLMLCKIWSFHGCDYEECRLLGCDFMYSRANYSCVLFGELNMLQEYNIISCCKLVIRKFCVKD